MTDDPTDADGRRTPPAAGSPSGPMAYGAITVSVASAILLLGGVLFAFASADASNADAADRFRLLGQAANPFIAFLALTGSAIVVHLRRSGEETQRAAAAALGIGTAVCLAVGLLALNGVVTDLTGPAGVLFKLSAVVQRLAAVALAALGLWLSITAVPPKRAR